MSKIEVSLLGIGAVKLRSERTTLYVDAFSEIVRPQVEKADLILVTHGDWDHFEPQETRAPPWRRRNRRRAARDCLPAAGSHTPAGGAAAHSLSATFQKASARRAPRRQAQGLPDQTLQRLGARPRQLLD